MSSFVNVRWLDTLFYSSEGVTCLKIIIVFKKYVERFINFFISFGLAAWPSYCNPPQLTRRPTTVQRASRCGLAAHAPPLGHASPRSSLQLALGYPVSHAASLLATLELLIPVAHQDTYSLTLHDNIKSLTYGIHIRWVPHVTELMSPKISLCNVIKSQSRSPLSDLPQYTLPTK